MQRLHDSGLAHGDLHEDNVCVDIEGDRVTACVIDFGSSFFRHDQREFEGARQHDQDHLQSIERRMKGAPTTDSDVDWEADFYVELNGSWGDSRGGSPWEDSTDPELEQVTDLLSEWQFDVASDTEGRISPEGEGLLRQDE